MNSIYKKYKERLVEISGKNRSLFAKKIGRQYAFDIGKILKKDSENTNLFLEFLMKGKRTGFTLISKESRQKLFDAFNINEKLEKKFLDKKKMTANEARSESLRRERLKKEEMKKVNIFQVNSLRLLKREVDEFAKETGRYEMFVGYPFVQGELNKDTMIKGPLLLFPMTINVRDEYTVDIEFKRDEPIQLNKVFILAYAKQHKLVIDNLIQEFDSSNKFNFQTVREVVDYLNTFGFKLRYTDRVSLEDFEEGGEPHRGDKLTVRNYAVIGRFPLANSIYNDYVTLEKQRLTTPAIEMLLNSKQMQSSKSKEENSYPITESDYAQQKSLEEISKSGNVVIFGPPGTGKSQSIVNIISDSIAKGKRVLVVSQKKVAMDVVYHRLGILANRTMYLTDVDKSATMFYDKVKRVHNEVLSEYISDAKEKFDKITNDIKSEVTHLEELSNALFNPLPYGVSLQKLYSTTPQIKKGTNEYNVYKNLLDNKEIMELDYHTLKSITEKIYDKKTDNLYHKYNALISKNQFVPFLKMDINIEDLNNLKVFIDKLLSSSLQPFDFGKFVKVKSVLFMYLASPKIPAKEISKVIKIIAKNEAGASKKSRKEYLERVQQLESLYSELKEETNTFIGETKLLKKALTNEGYSLIVDNILSGSNPALRLLSNALKDYATIKDMRLALEGVSANEKAVLKFALDNSTSEEEMHQVIGNMLNTRNYHEIVKAEEQEDRKLSFILDYENTKQRIITLKSEIFEINKEIAYVSFNDRYSKYYNSRKDNKDYLYVINKQENMWNIRKTMEYFSEYLLNLFPCWMMSPENVSSVMPLKQDLFDVIVFDEASQIFIENSIPTIYRGKSVAIAGDRKQLKPTTTFMKRYMGNEALEELTLSEQAALEVESLLDLATSRYSNANLTYHYRSKYEELINFSNYAFYDEKLQIAPNISKNVYKPIERIKVNGKWIERRNHEEAIEVVKTIKKIFETRENNETIGVITFNTEQEHYIEDIIDVECQKDPVFREKYLKECARKENGEDTGLFIKNIENVQGEERDIIIFSIGYAKNERGKVVAQFGPLSMEGGENRLNVAITRAKEKIYLITSIEPEDLNVTYSKNIGPKVLKKYLQYARAVSFDNKYEQKIILESLRKKTIIEENISEGIEKEIQEALQKKKYIVDTNIGNAKYKINLAIYNKKLDRYVLGIEIDSNAYHSSEDLLERDVYRTKFLNSRGWNMMRLWSRDWWTDKDQTIELIEKNIEKAIQKITEEKAQIKKKKSQSSKKEVNIDDYIEENPLADNLFAKKPIEKPVISTRLSKKVLARLEEDELNAEKLNKEIEEINENPDYDLVLEPIDFNEKKKKSRKKKEEIVVEVKEENKESIENPKTEKAKKPRWIFGKKSDNKYIDEVEEKYQGKKDKVAERKNRQLDKAHEKDIKAKEREIARKEKEKALNAERERKAQEKENAKQEKIKAKAEKKKQAQLDKRYNKKEMAKVKSQLDSLSTISALRKSKERKEAQEAPKKVAGIVPQKTMARKKLPVKNDTIVKEEKTVVAEPKNNATISKDETKNTLAVLERLKNKTSSINSNSEKKNNEEKTTNASNTDSTQTTNTNNSSNSSLQSLLTRLKNKDK